MPDLRNSRASGRDEQAGIVIDIRLHDRVVEQGRLLLQLLSAVRERSGEPELGDDVLHIADLMFHGLDRIYEGLDDVVTSASVAGGEPAEAIAEEPAYPEIIEYLREQVTRHVPSGEIVAVVSRGDSALVDFPESEGWHYPQNEVGTWAGYHPRDGADALTSLDVLRAVVLASWPFQRPAHGGSTGMSNLRSSWTSRARRWSATTCSRCSPSLLSRCRHSTRHCRPMSTRHCPCRVSCR
jgi:hypothetical protein